MARKPQGGKPPATTRARKKGRDSATPESAVAGDSPDDSTPGRAVSGEKLQKVLARAGLGSRREMERWIEEGRITVDNRPASLGDRVDDRARISVDGKQLERVPAQKTRCILYHKPTGEVCSRKDPQGRRTVFQRLPKLKSGSVLNMTYYSSDAQCPKKQIETRIGHISSAREGRFEGHCTIDLLPVNHASLHN